MSARQIAMFPLAVLLGAVAVLIGGVVQVALLGGGYAPATPIPPDTSFAAFAIALALSLVADRVLRMGMIGNLGVTLGFLAMCFGETHLAAAFPEFWIGLYSGDFATIPPGAQIAGVEPPSIETAAK